MNVLIVEDDPEDVEGLRRQCLSRGWHVLVARTFFDAATALSAASEVVWSVVVLDIMLTWGGKMPDPLTLGHSDSVGGVLLLEAMRGCEPGRSVIGRLMDCDEFFKRNETMPVVVLSKFPEMESRCQSLGIYSFHKKAACDFIRLAGEIGSAGVP